MGRLRYVLGLAAAVGLWACLSPTLPLPPPDLPDSIYFSTSDVWVIAGTCTPGAKVVVTNEVTHEGANTEETRDGRYVVALEAKLCETASVQEIIGSELSSPTTFVVEMTGPAAPVEQCGGVTPP